MFGLTVALVVFLLAGLLVDFTPKLGRWAFTRRPDGTFSRSQIAGQVLVVGWPVLLILFGFACMFASWIAVTIHGLLNN